MLPACPPALLSNRRPAGPLSPLLCGLLVLVLSAQCSAHFSPLLSPLLAVAVWSVFTDRFLLPAGRKGHPTSALCDHLRQTSVLDHH